MQLTNLVNIYEFITNIGYVISKLNVMGYNEMIAAMLTDMQ